MNAESSRESRNGFHALRQYVRPRAPQERCDLCAAPVPPLHTHLLEAAGRALLCSCDACAILFSAPDSKYRRVPRRVRAIRNFQAADGIWEDLAIPINMAYFYHDSAARQTRASYPSPAGATESALDLGAWRELVIANPILESIEPDVEALLVNRLTAEEYFLLPIDECFRLVGLIRTHWQGFSGGAGFQRELLRFFESLRQRAIDVEASHA